MKRFGRLLAGAALAAVFGLQAAPASGQAPDRDFLGYWKQSRQYRRVAAKGITVVDMPQEGSFFAVYTPPGGSTDRVMVLLHGTGGTAYDAMGDDIDLAERHGYTLVGLQWLDKGAGRYADALKVNRMIDKALRYIERESGRKPSKVALSGFSRGSVTAFQVVYHDSQAEKNVDLVIAHSGGIPTESVVAPGEGAGPIDRFFAELASGAFDSPYKGIDFFLYAGCKDEQWGTKMCAYMRYTQELVEKNGGRIVRCIIDENGGHAGYIKTPAYHEAAVDAFLSL